MHQVSVKDTCSSSLQPKFGEEVLYEDALNIVLPEAYEAAVTELGLDVVAQPKSMLCQWKKGKSGHFLLKL